MAPPEATEPLAPLAQRMSAREWMLCALDLMVQAAWWEVGCQKVRELYLVLAYADWHSHTGRKRRIPMNVDALVAQWVEVIVELATAHDHARRTAADHQTDDLLGPLLTAPIAQIRQFGQQLAAALKADPRVPFLIWSSFERVLEPLILKGPDGELLALKTQLAAEIATLVERGLDREELIVAIAGALQWRAPSRLEAVKAKLEQGEKPRIRGRESCLFLEAGDELVVL
jgi:hypothetical protein